MLGRADTKSLFYVNMLGGVGTKKIFPLKMLEWAAMNNLL